jgi:phosphotransferase system, enzyme I, PtsP
MGVLDALKLTAQAMSSAKTLKDAMQVLLETICKQIETDACSIFVVDEKKDDFVLVATTRLKYLLPGQCRIARGEGLVSAIAVHAEPILLEDATQDPRNVELVALGTESAYRAFMGVPIIHVGEVLGVVIAQNASTRMFSEGDEAFVVTR